jgi:hypothetical protein
MVWLLLGLLFNATGLYLGFDYSLSFWYIMIGWFCCAYGAAIFVLRLRERPRSPAETRLSPQFVAAGATFVGPALSSKEQTPVTEQSGTE